MKETRRGKYALTTRTSKILGLLVRTLAFTPLEIQILSKASLLMASHALVLVLVATISSPEPKPAPIHSRSDKTASTCNLLICQTQSQGLVALNPKP